ncbi:MAG: SpoIID/LytB domain-containing protein [Anaerovoracaceae bacterium]
MNNIKKFTVIIIMMTAFFASALSVHAVSDSYIKVGLKYGSSAPSSVKISADSGLVLCSAESGTVAKAGNELDGYQTVTMNNGGTCAVIRDTSGNTIASIPADGSVCIAAAGIFSSDEPVSSDGTSYRGGIMPYLNSSGQMNIINYVSREDYLRGVLASEMMASYELEALKAQAITARSFQLANQSTHASQGFSVCSTTHCQVYGGVSKEYARTDQAVAETAGQLLYYDGQPVAGYYYSNSGGHTENSEDVWSSFVGYLRGKADPYSPEKPWTVRLTKKEIFNALSAQGIGDIQSVTVDSVNASGYVASITVKGSRSSITKTKDSVRSVFGSAGSLRSRMFTISTEGGTLTGGGTATVPASGTWYARSASGTVVLGENLNVLTADGMSTQKLNGTKVIRGDGTTSTLSYTPAYTVSSGQGTTVTFSSDSDVLILSGNGYGHGVGMSQEGAQEMAKQGFSCQDILKFYYTDVEVK